MKPEFERLPCGNAWAYRPTIKLSDEEKKDRELKFEELLKQLEDK